MKPPVDELASTSSAVFKSSDTTICDPPTRGSIAVLTSKATSPVTPTLFHQCAAVWDCSRPQSPS
eukprot:3115965-Pleurochrysis_carterae.AAC.1